MSVRNRRRIVIPPRPDAAPSLAPKIVKPKKLSKKPSQKKS